MANRNGLKWTREETILAFELYCRTPFGKIHHSNPDIIDLSKLLGRTADSVALKMQNLAHYDPELRARNVSALAHGSKLDPEIFEEFYMNLEELTFVAASIRAEMAGGPMDIQSIIRDLAQLPPGEYSEQIVKTRLGQQYFRTAVLNSYGNRCCVTGLSVPDLLIASHIKPWADSDIRTERTNPCNGLCLNPFHDRAFDQGYITIDNKFTIIASRKLKDSGMDETTQDWFMSYVGKQIILPDKFIPGKEFIEYHNDVIFKG